MGLVGLETYSRILEYFELFKRSLSPRTPIFQKRNPVCRIYRAEDYPNFGCNQIWTERGDPDIVSSDYICGLNGRNLEMQIKMNYSVNPLNPVGNSVDPLNPMNPVGIIEKEIKDAMQLAEKELQERFLGEQTGKDFFYRIDF